MLLHWLAEQSNLIRYQIATYSIEPTFSDSINPIGFFDGYEIDGDRYHIVYSDARDDGVVLKVTPIDWDTIIAKCNQPPDQELL